MPLAINNIVDICRFMQQMHDELKEQIEKAIEESSQDYIDQKAYDAIVNDIKSLEQRSAEILAKLKI